MSKEDQAYGRGYSKSYDAGCLRRQAYEKKIAAMQSKIDALMLEYCPEDMTPEQIENWKKHQVASPLGDSGE